MNILIYFTMCQIFNVHFHVTASYISSGPRIRVQTVSGNVCCRPLINFRVVSVSSIWPEDFDGKTLQTR